MMADLIGQFVPWALGALALLAGYFVNNKVQQRKGHKKAEDEAKDADNDRANEIRDRVNAGPDERMREAHDDAGWRD